MGVHGLGPQECLFASSHCANKSALASMPI